MFRKWTPKKILIKAAKVVGYTVLSIVGLLILVAVAIQIPAVQRRLVAEAVAFVEKKIGTKVSLAHLGLSFPKAIVLEGLYLEDQKTDTLLYIGRLSVDTDLWALTDNTIELNDISLNNADIRVKRSAVDSAFNFDYIIESFAGTEQPADTTPSKPWTFNLEGIELNQVKAQYTDSITSLDARVRLTQLEIGIDKLDLNGPDIRVDEVTLTDMHINVVSWQQPADTLAEPVQLAELPVAQDTGSFNMGFNRISLQDIAADYRQTALGQHARINLGQLEVTAREIDLIKKVISLEKFELSNSFISYQQSPGKYAAPPAGTQSSVKQSPTRAEDPTALAQAATDSLQAFGLDWNLSLEELNLSNNNVQYYDFNEPSVPGLDFNHLWFTRLSLAVEDLEASGEQARLSVRSLEFSERSGFILNQFQVNASVDNNQAALTDLVVETPHSNIRGSAKASYGDLRTLAREYADTQFDLQLQPSFIAVDDALLFAPDLLVKAPVHVPAGAILKFEARANGQVKDITVTRFALSYLDSTELLASGRMTGLPAAGPGFALNLKKLYTTRKNIEALLPDSLLPSSVQLPDWVSLTGTAQGTFDNPAAKVQLTSNLGTVRLDGTFRNVNLKTAAYDASVDLEQFDVGRLLRQEETMGAITVHAAAKGRGFTQETLNTKVDLVIEKFLYNQYLYRDFQVHGTLVKYLFSGSAWLKDPNLDFRLDGDLDYTGDIPEYALKFDLKNADFRALHLSERPLKARMILETKLATKDFTSINGNLDIRKVGIYNGDALYLVDSLLFASIDQTGDSKISIRSDIISGDFAGTMNLVAMPDALRRHFNNYFSLHDTAYSKPVAAQKFSFNLVLKNTELITEILVPDLEPFVPGRIEGQFDSQNKVLDLHADVSRIQYGDVGLDSLTLDVQSDASSLNYTLGLRKIRFDTLRMEALRIGGKVANDSIRTKLLILDTLLKDKYALGGAFYSLENTFQFRFLPGQVIMNYAPWTTPADNYLRFTDKGILAHNFSITNINESISFVTREEKDERTAIVFKDLNLQNLTNIVEAKVLVDGLINGDFMLSGTGQFKTELGIKALEILGVEWGDLTLKLSHEATNQYLVDLGINGINMEFGVNGTYLPDSVTPQVDLTADISRINLAAIDPLTSGQLKNSSGSLTGEVTLQGSPTAPEIRGFLAFQKAAIVPTLVNTKFLLTDERIALTEEGIVLENFEIRDEKDNVATIKGALKTKDYTTFGLDLRFNAENFQLLDTKEGENELFYGKVGINTTATILGTFTEPKISMNVSLNEDSKATYIIPQAEKGVLDQKGIVVFVDKDAEKDPFLRSINPRDSVASQFTGIDLTANIQLDEEEELSVVIDPLTGDKLTVKGNATLTLDINPSGDLQLAGRYEITEGTYDFTFYKFLKRNFKIVKGSTITWNGDPVGAVLDIRASYEVETSPMELMITNAVSGTLDNTYRQRLPFLVYLNIDGELMTPEISFELDMPEEKRNVLAGAVYARLQAVNTEESELNKQVFALLILKRFMTTDVFQSESGSSAEGTARRSVSKLLSEQLNKMSEGVKGVELSFDIRSDEDYSTGEAQGQTSVQLGVSKSLLDDRLIVKISGNVEVEGQTSQSSLTDYIGDLALEYKLTEDGRFRITGFRNSDYDLISGELTETGAGLIYIKDYDTLRELFKANAKSK